MYNTMELQLFMPKGKAAKQELEQKIKNMYTSGDFNPLDIEIGVKGIKDAVDNIRKDWEVKEAVTEALSYYPEKTVELDGAQITKKKTPTQYDFSVCGDPVYNRLVSRLEEIRRAVKDREEFLKAIKTKEVITDQETGETVEVQEPLKFQGETYAIKFI